MRARVCSRACVGASVCEPVVGIRECACMRAWSYAHVLFRPIVLKLYAGVWLTPSHSPVNLSPKSPNLDKIATETLFVVNDSHTQLEQHIKNIDDRMQAKVA